jgi:hypothetical protein
VYDAVIRAAIVTLCSASALLLSRAPGAHAEEALGKSGRFGTGVGIELLGLGPVEVASAGGAGAGLGLVTALQLDLGPRWALRLPVSLDLAFSHAGASFVDLWFSPGLRYRFRDQPRQRWVPYLGGGPKLGAAGGEHDLLGLPPAPGTLAFAHEHHGGSHFFGHADDPNFEATGGLGVEVWGGFEQRLNDWLTIDWDLAYAWMRVDGVGVHVLRQTMALRLTL